MREQPVSQACLKALLDYDPDTGIFVWKASRPCGVKQGQIAGSIGNRGHRMISINGASHLAHRLAWLYVHGEWPPAQIDHINGRRSDNRIVNLRLATPTQNNQNKRHWKTVGFKGVRFRPQTGNWQARITVGGKTKSLGSYPSPEAAHAAYAAAAYEHFGEFARVS